MKRIVKIPDNYLDEREGSILASLYVLLLLVIHNNIFVPSGMFHITRTILFAILFLFSYGLIGDYIQALAFCA